MIKKQTKNDRFPLFQNPFACPYRHAERHHNSFLGQPCSTMRTRCKAPLTNRSPSWSTICCPRDCTCWQARRRSANRGWRCGCVSAPRRASRSGHSPHAPVRCCTSVWRTAFSVGQAEHILHRKVQLGRAVIPLCLGDHLRGGVRRLDVRRRVHDVFCDQPRAGCQLQHCFVTHDWLN